MVSELVVCVKGLRRNASVGILDHERRGPQPLIIDTDFHLDPTLVLSEPSIDNTIDYVNVVERITDFLDNQSHIDLLETMADRIIDLFWDHGSIQQVTIRLQKPAIVENCDATTIKLTRQR